MDDPFISQLHTPDENAYGPNDLVLMTKARRNLFCYVTCAGLRKHITARDESRSMVSRQELQTGCDHRPCGLNDMKKSANSDGTQAC
jgi:hypothetical protein